MKIRSASCSIAPESLRSDIWGLLLGLCSTALFNWDKTITGALISFAKYLRALEISESSFTLFSVLPGICIN